MSIPVMVIVGIALVYAAWRLWGAMKGTGDCGCGNSVSSCSKCSGCSGQKQLEDNQEKNK